MAGVESAALALLVRCGFCWAEPGAACAEQGQHLARYLRAHRRGLIGADVVRAICLALPRISAGQVVADVAAPPQGTCASPTTSGPWKRERPPT